MKSIRDGLTPDEISIGSASVQGRLLSLDAVRSATHFFVYVSFRSEVATHELIDRLLNRGKTVAVPHVVGGERMEAVRFGNWAEMTRDRFGVLTPDGAEIDERSIDVCIGPGLAFTSHGDRLGYGKGHYDRFLAHRPPELLIGLAFECHIVETVPVESFDRPMDLIVTDRRVIDRRGSRE